MWMTQWPRWRRLTLRQPILNQAIVVSFFVFGERNTDWFPNQSHTYNSSCSIKRDGRCQAPGSTGTTTFSCAQDIKRNRQSYSNYTSPIGTSHFVYQPSPVDLHVRRVRMLYYHNIEERSHSGHLSWYKGSSSSILGLCQCKVNAMMAHTSAKIITCKKSFCQSLVVKSSSLISFVSVRRGPPKSGLQVKQKHQSAQAASSRARNKQS